MDKLPNPSPMEIIISEFRIDEHLDAILCSYYEVTKGYFLRLQKAYDDMEERRK